MHRPFHHTRRRRLGLLWTKVCTKQGMEIRLLSLNHCGPLKEASPYAHRGVCATAGASGRLVIGLWSKTGDLETAPHVPLDQ